MIVFSLNPPIWFSLIVCLPLFSAFVDVSPEEGLQKDTFEKLEESLETDPSKDVSFSNDVKLFHEIIY